MPPSLRRHSQYPMQCVPVRRFWKGAVAHTSPCSSAPTTASGLCGRATASRSSTMPGRPSGGESSRKRLLAGGCRPDVLMRSFKVPCRRSRQRPLRHEGRRQEGLQDLRGLSALCPADEAPERPVRLAGQHAPVAGAAPFWRRRRSYGAQGEAGEGLPQGSRDEAAERNVSANAPFSNALPLTSSPPSQRPDQQVQSLL
jgi:hypothetical protein